MANEITLSIDLSYKSGKKKPSMSFANLRFDVSGSDYIEATQNIGTSAEALAIGDITTPGWCAMYNSDTTNFVEIRDGAAGADVIKIPAGGVALFYLTTSTPYAIADTAAVDLEYLIVEA